MHLQHGRAYNNLSGIITPRGWKSSALWQNPGVEGSPRAQSHKSLPNDSILSATALQTDTWLTQAPTEEMDFQGGSVLRKESPCQCRRLQFDPWVGKILRRKKWQPIPASSPGKPQTEEPGGLQFMGLWKSWTWLSTQKQEATCLLFFKWSQLLRTAFLLWFESCLLWPPLTRLPFTLWS